MIICKLCRTNGNATNMALVALQRHLAMAHGLRFKAFEEVVQHYQQTLKEERTDAET